METQSDTGGGVTLTPTAPPSEDGVKGGKRYRKYCFVIYNWTETQKHTFLLKAVELAKWYVVGEEICPETGTPHLQGFVEWRNAMTWDNMRKVVSPGNIRVAKGDEQENLAYCSKDGIFTTNIVKKETRTERVLRLEYENVEWKEWQSNVLDLIDSQYGDRRTINWFWEPSGNAGKSFCTKYVICKYDPIVASGKTADIFNQVRTWLDAHKETDDPKLVIIDIPRCNLDYVNYQAMEALKNGALYSGKYEGGLCVFPCPVVIVFANAPPDLGQLSADRWNIHKIEE